MSFYLWLERWHYKQKKIDREIRRQEEEEKLIIKFTIQNLNNISKAYCNISKTISYLRKFSSTSKIIDIDNQWSEPLKVDN